MADALFEDFRNYIRPDDVRAAYDRFLSTPRFLLVPRWSGPTPPGKAQHKRSIAFTKQGTPKQGFYAFIVNQSSLLFYIRRPALCDQWTLRRAALSERFQGGFRENPAGEWTVKVRTVADVEFLDLLSATTPFPLGPLLETRFLLGARIADPHVRLDRRGELDRLVVSPNGSKTTTYGGPDGRSEREIALSRDELWTLALNLLAVLRKPSMLKREQ